MDPIKRVHAKTRHAYDLAAQTYHELFHDEMNEKAYDRALLDSFATRLDLAVVHYWYPLEPNCARFLQEDLKVGHIALGHLPIRLESDAPGKIDMVRQYYQDIFLLLPGTPAIEALRLDRPR